MTTIPTIDTPSALTTGRTAAPTPTPPRPNANRTTPAAPTGGGASISGEARGKDGDRPAALAAGAAAVLAGGPPTTDRRWGWGAAEAAGAT